MERNPLIKDAIDRHIKILETEDPNSPEFRRANAVVEAYRHEDILLMHDDSFSMHKDTMLSARKLINLTWVLVALTFSLLILTGFLTFQSCQQPLSTVPSVSHNTLGDVPKKPKDKTQETDQQREIKPHRNSHKISHPSNKLPNKTLQ